MQSRGLGIAGHVEIIVLCDESMRNKNGGNNELKEDIPTKGN
jgi:hypothetical protein